MLSVTGNYSQTPFPPIVDSGPIASNLQEGAAEEKSISNESLDKIQSASICSFNILQDKAVLQRIVSSFELADIAKVMLIEKACVEMLNDDYFWKMLGQNLNNFYKEPINTKEEFKSFLENLKKVVKKCQVNFGMICKTNKTEFSEVRNSELMCEMINTTVFFNWLISRNFEGIKTDYDNVVGRIEFYEKNTKTYHYKRFPNEKIDIRIVLVPVSVFKCFKSLEVLQLSGNIDSLPNNLDEIIPNVRILNLQGNNLTDNDLKKIAKLKHLEELNLAGNEITNLSPEFLEFIKNLKKIDLRFNNIHHSDQYLVVKQFLDNLTNEVRYTHYLTEFEIAVASFWTMVHLVVAYFAGIDISELEHFSLMVFSIISIYYLSLMGDDARRKWGHPND